MPFVFLHGVDNIPGRKACCMYGSLNPGPRGCPCPPCMYVPIDPSTMRFHIEQNSPSCVIVNSDQTACPCVPITTTIYICTLLLLPAYFTSIHTKLYDVLCTTIRVYIFAPSETNVWHGVQHRSLLKACPSSTTPGR